jgi:pre-60S factor REI1
MAGVTCYTAPGTIFEDRESLQEHYKSEWHRYNLKRKVAGLPPLPRDQFEARKNAALAAKGEQDAKAASHKLDHVKEGKKEKVAERVAQRKQQLDEVKGSVVPPKAPTEEEEGAEGEGTMEDDAEVQEEEFEADMRRSLFDSNLSEDVDSNLAYMAQTFGFFLPDVEYVSDLHGLVEYLHEKVRCFTLDFYIALCL